MSTTWLEAAKQKIAMSAPQDDKAITEAFAQQAYTAVGNRDREIMRDPYLLGFEIVTKNEENTRLVGVFCFRVSGEILLVPVFYLNGQIKGQDLLYRKGVNRFYPNTDKWISYLLSRGEDKQGRGVRRDGPDARIHVNLQRLAGQDLPMKGASADATLDAMIKQACAKEQAVEDIGKGPIAALWKEAMDAWTVVEPEYLFADIVIEQGMQKEAAQLAERLHEFAEMIEVGALLDHDKQAGFLKRFGENLASPPTAGIVIGGLAGVGAGLGLGGDQTLMTVLPGVGGALGCGAGLAYQLTAGKRKQARLLAKRESGEPLTEQDKANLKYLEATEKKATLTLFRNPAPGWTEPQLEEFYKRGFSLMDEREMAELASAFDESPMSESLTTISQAGVQQVRDLGGETRKALWAPVIDDNDCPSVAGYNDDTQEPDYLLVLLEGKDKGCAIRYSRHSGRGEMPVFEDDSEVEIEATSPETDDVSGESPQAGKTYTLWFPGMQKVFGTPFIVRSVQKQGDLTKINFDSDQGPKLVVRADIEQSNMQDFTPDRGLPRVCGKDVVFVPVTANAEYSNGQPRTARNLCWATLTPPADFRPLTRERIDSAMLKTKSASIEIVPDDRGSRFDVLCNGRTRCRDLSHLELVCKLARDLHLPAAEAISFADEAREGKKLAFRVISPKERMKLAGFLDRALDSVNEGVHSVQDKLEGWGHKAEEGMKSVVNRFGLPVPDKVGERVSDAGANILMEEFPSVAPLKVIPPKGGIPNPFHKAVLSSPSEPPTVGEPAITGKAAGILSTLALDATADVVIDSAIQGKDKKKKDDDSDDDDVPTLGKKSHTYYDRDIDPETEFANYDFDQDLGVPMDLDRHQAMALAMRNQSVSPQRRYMDAKGNGEGFANKPHGRGEFASIPDDVIMQMSNPGMELAQIGQQMGVGALIDHGAVGALTKVFDAAPFIVEYVEKLEGSLDYLARLLFMLFWKPKDFAKLFGTDDLPQLENKLTGVFLGYGDLVLELRQSAGDKI